ncbi:MAG TPA: aminodeoxychorismate synthase component I [Actinomycetota bacterium]
MLEARFDDLTGREESFRLAEPVGVLEAGRTEEVAATIAAAEAAARRGLWVAGFVAYEAAPGLDPALRVRGREPGDPFERLPLAWFAMFERREPTLLPEPPDAPADDDGSAWRPSVDRARYDGAIDAIRERIAAGDTYQVNHTLRLRSRVTGDPRGLYRDLCYAQRGAHAAYVDAGRYRICSASPELFFRIDGSRLTTRPMKGTAPRGRWLEEDEAIRARLQGSVKDRAENAMIVDLLRNDLGRVARTGTVTWSDVFEAERYETVWQLTSTVAAELEPTADLEAVFRALFPCGSVTGAPKASTMAIVAALEDSPRGVYCGTVGYLAPPGADGPRARFNVAIRTVVVDAETGTAEYGVGGGITWDSRAASEYDETVAKARVLTARRPRFELLETLRHEPGTGFRRLPEHLARLRASAAYFGFRFDEGEVRRALDAAAAIVPDRPARVRLLLDRRGAVTTGAVPMPPSPEPVRLAVDVDHPVDPDDVMLFHKTTLRAPYDEARARHPDADDVVLVNVRGEATETTIANLALRLDGRWWTPPVDAGLLAGTERAALLADGTLAERTITVAELRMAEDLAVLSSVRGWRPAELV